jgi:hypothetical protein
LARGKSHPRAIEYLVWLGGFVSAAIILIILGRIALRLLQEAEMDNIDSMSAPSGRIEIATGHVYLASNKK